MTKPGKALESNELAHPSSFCWNEKRADYGRVDAGNLSKRGSTRKGRQQRQCATCKKVFPESKGTAAGLLQTQIRTLRISRKALPMLAS